jgi:tetratricopeptide (TPR) repeat protein
MSRIGLYLEKLSLLLLALFVAVFPFAITTQTTEFYVLPKQLFLTGSAILLLVLLGLRWVLDKEIRLRRTPFDIPVLLFLGVSLLSSILSVNRSESFIAFAPVLLAGVLYFVITNTTKTKASVFVLVGSFLLSSSVLAFSAVLNFAKVYVWPFDFAKSQTFTPLGSLIDQGVLLAIAFSLALYLLTRQKSKLKLKNLTTPPNLLLILASLTTLVGLGLTIYLAAWVQKPVILPFPAGFQISFAAISQDTARLLQSFLFGSGFGTFSADYARFKQASLNLTPYWNLTFIRSSSLVLELLATTGVLGLLSFLYLALRVVREKPLFIPGALYLLSAFLLPLSFATQAFLFILLGIHAVWLGLSSNRIFEIELAIVTLKKGLVGAFNPDSKTIPHGGLSRVLPFLIFLIILAAAGTLGFLTVRYALANTIFQTSILATQQNKGTEAYQQQSRAISLVGYSDAYQRVFSQTNLALANSLSQEARKVASPSAETQQTIYTLIQQAINSGRSATDLAPATSLNWQNLSSIYRALIGFGRNADQFAIQAAQQAVRLDPNNPQQYINLGGLYYQLKEWDKAIEQFRLAINIKPDFANAYYNLAYSLKEKGDLEGAIAQLNTVKELVKNDSTNLKKVTEEIKALEAGIKGEEAPEVVETLPPQESPVPIASPSAQ